MTKNINIHFVFYNIYNVEQKTEMLSVRDLRTYGRTESLEENWSVYLLHDNLTTEAGNLYIDNPINQSTFHYSSTERARSCFQGRALLRLLDTSTGWKKPSLLQAQCFFLPKKNIKI